MHYKILADKTRYFKEDAKGVAAMCKIMEELSSIPQRSMQQPLHASSPTLYHFNPAIII